MEPIESHTGKVFPLNRANVDTDQIIPKQFLTRIERTGYGQFVFYHWRFDDDGNKRPDFLLNDPNYEDSSILLSKENFGCGSSREHAPWALKDYGFRVVIAPSFADIFYNNSLKNGLVPIVINEEQVDEWMERALNGKLTLSMNLKTQIIRDESGKEVPFDIPKYHKEKLINGWDDIALTLQLEDKIVAYENR
ncbi:MAG TPA: 3-isopropylmalate dehydratase small subunit [Bacillota bacterium]|nr:3-isopropylmalate dehydratase small subunit [Bacillota bacterium]